MAQSVEHVLGKDGVGSSNLPSSSRKTAQNGRFSFVFYCFLAGKNGLKNAQKILVVKNTQNGSQILALKSHLSHLPDKPQSVLSKTP